MKIYTRTGDEGTTGLLGGSRIAKDSPRIVAIGEVDELNAAIGLARVAAVGSPLDRELHDLQNWLFDLGSEIACPPDGKFEIRAITDKHVERLETSMDRMTDALPPLKAFIPSPLRLIFTWPAASAGARNALSLLSTIGSPCARRPANS